MKKLAVLIIGLMTLAGFTPATAAQESGLGPTGLLEAKKSGFDGSGFQFGVLAREFSNKFPSLDGMFASEACFAGEQSWETKCSNGESTQFGAGAALTDVDYSNVNSLVYGLIGSQKMIAPKAKAHAIRTLENQQRLPEIIDYALEKGLDALFYTDTWAYPTRGMELNCDAKYPEVAAAVSKASELGLAIFANSSGGGNTYGLTFPNCITGVVPVGNLDYEGQLDQSLNLGPGLVVSHARFESLAPSLHEGKESFYDYPDFFRAMAVVGGIYGALLSDGYSPDVALEAIGNSTQTMDGLFVKDIPVANYLDAKAWAQAQSLAEPGLVLATPVQVSAKGISLNLLGDPGAETRIVGYELFDTKSSKWQRVKSDANSTLAMVIEPSQKSGWVRLVLQADSGEELSTAAKYAIASSYNPSFGINLEQESGVVPTVPAEPEYSSDPLSSNNWPTITDPALRLIELQYARDMQVTGKGVTVAIIDDGVQEDHPYLVGNRVQEGLCLEMDESCPNGTNKQFGAEAINPKIPEDREERDSHGTMVAGTIGGYPTAQAQGGIAPEVTFVVARVDLNGSDENGDYIVQALKWIYDLSFEYNISSINMSFGYMRGERDQILNGSSCENDFDYEEITEKLIARGVAPVVASGNDGLVQGIGGPACEGTSIAVGAADNDGSIINYSNISDAISVVAPARTITSLGDGAFREGSGTSNATPVVAGAFALARQLRPELSVDEVLFAMQESADLVDDIYVKDLPRLNIRKFLDYLAEGGGFDQQKPGLSVTSLGLSCAVEIESNDATQLDLRYRVNGSQTWSQVVAASSPFLIGDLEASTNYEIEVGGLHGNKILWSERKSCQTSAGSVPNAIQTARVEARGADWVVAYVPPSEANGHPLTFLNYRADSGSNSRAIPLGGNRYYFASVSGISLAMQFENTLGEGVSYTLELPSYIAPRVPQAFTKTTTLTGFKTSALLAAHKTKLAKELGSLEGVTTITCTGYFATNATTATKNVIKQRATNSCAESRKLHPAATTVVKTTSTKTKTAVGTVKVVVTGSN